MPTKPCEQGRLEAFHTNLVPYNYHREEVKFFERGAQLMRKASVCKKTILPNLKHITIQCAEVDFGTSKASMARSVAMNRSLVIMCRREIRSSRVYRLFYIN